MLLPKDPMQRSLHGPPPRVERVHCLLIHSPHLLQSQNTRAKYAKLLKQRAANHREDGEKRSGVHKAQEQADDARLARPRSWGETRPVSLVVMATEGEQMSRPIVVAHSLERVLWSITALPSCGGKTLITPRLCCGHFCEGLQKEEKKHRFQTRPR